MEHQQPEAKMVRNPKAPPVQSEGTECAETVRCAVGGVGSSTANIFQGKTRICMFEIHCRENFLLITFQFSAGRPARSWASAPCTSCPRRLDGLSSGTSSPLGLPHSRAGKHLRETGHCSGISCSSSPQRMLELGQVMWGWRWSTWGNISPLQPLVPHSMLSLGVPGKAPQWDGAACLPTAGLAPGMSPSLSRGSGNAGTQQQSPSSPLQGVVVSACAAPAQAETIPTFGGAGGAKLPGKGATGASPGVCLSPAEPRW